MTYDQRSTYLHDLTTLGDPSTGTVGRTAYMRVETSTGVVLIEAGRVVASAEDESTVFRAGLHAFDDYVVDGDPGVLEPICSALS